MMTRDRFGSSAPCALPPRHLQPNLLCCRHWPACFPPGFSFAILHHSRPVWPLPVPVKDQSGEHNCISRGGVFLFFFDGCPRPPTKKKRSCRAAATAQLSRQMTQKATLSSQTQIKKKKSRTLHIEEFNITNIQQFWTHTIRSSSDF